MKFLIFEIIKHNLKLLTFFKEKEVRKLPFRVLWQSFRLMQNEKITKIDGKIFINNYIPPFPSRAIGAHFRGYREMSEGKFSSQTAIISLTNKCCCNCKICYNRNYAGEEMSLVQIKKIIQEVQELGFFRIALSGGEPTLRKDLEEIINSIDDRSFPVLLTNGIGLTIKRAKAFKKAGLRVIKISLDHYEKNKVDEKRGFAGAFDGAISAINISKKIGLYVVVTIVITKDILNSEEIYKYIDFVEKIGGDEVFIMEPKPYFILEEKYLLNNKDKDKLYKLQLEINRNKKRKITVSVYNYHTHSFKFGCNAGSRYLYINAMGGVSPCPSVGLSFGNIKNESITDIYKKIKNLLPYPRKHCLFVSTKREVENNFKGKFPLGGEISRNIFKKMKLGDLPKENKRILRSKVLEKIMKV